MAIQIGAKPDSGFDDPIGMLKDCHRRIESFLGILCVVVDRAQGRSLPTRSAWQFGQHCSISVRAGNAILRMKRIPLSATAQIRCKSLRRDRPGLRIDHREANRLHASVEGLYLVWIEFGSLSPDICHNGFPDHTSQVNCLDPDRFIIFVLVQSCV